MEKMEVINNVIDIIRRLDSERIKWLLSDLQYEYDVIQYDEMYRLDEAFDGHCFEAVEAIESATPVNPENVKAHSKYEFFGYIESYILFDSKDFKKVIEMALICYPYTIDNFIKYYEDFERISLELYAYLSTLQEV